MSDSPRRGVISPVGYALICATAVACYANSLGGAMLMDDVNDIVQNQLVRDFEVVKIFTQRSWGVWVGADYVGYRPVTTLTFALNHLLHGLRPAGYHAVNVGLHAAVCVLLAGVLTLVTGSARLGLWSALLFAAHPIHTEAVANIIGRAEVLAALLALAAWRFVLHGRSGASRKLPWLLGAGGLLAAGILSKESAAAIVGVIVAVDLRRRADRAWLPYAVLIAAAVAAFGVRGVVQGWGAPVVISELDNPLVDQSLPVRIWTTLEVVALYVRPLLLPVGLSADYSYAQVPVSASPVDAGVLAGLGIVLLLTVAAAWSWKHSANLWCAIVLFAAPFSVPIALTFLGAGPIVAERLLYLPSAGFCLLLALGLARLEGAFANVPRLAPALAAAVIALYAGGTFARNRVWHDAQTFFEAMVSNAPLSARSHRELGLAYSRLGRHDQAVAEVTKSLAIMRRPNTSYDLGNVLLRAGRYPDAIAAYGDALAMQPNFVEAMSNLGNAYSSLGDEETAAAWFGRGLTINPSSADLHMNLANSLFRRGRAEEAAVEYRRAAELAPRSSVVRLNFGVCLEALGRPGEAVEQYRLAVAADPSSPLGYAKLAGALRAAGRADEARAVQSQAERLFGTGAVGQR